MILFEDRASTILFNVLKKIKNKKFLLPLNVCPIVPETFLKANKDFEFVDINFTNLCMDENIVLQKIQENKNIDGILFVKTFGVEFNIQPFFKKIKKINKDIFIIDDMCLCIPVFDYDINNSYADMALFSTGYSKYVDIGYGGYGFLKDEFFMEIFHEQSMTIDFKKYKKRIIKKILELKKHKKELNNIYTNGIPKEYHLGEQYNNWRFSILVENKVKILEEIFKVGGLFASSHYAQVDYNYVKNPMKNSNTKKIHDKIINLFNDLRFTKEKAHKVVEIINKNIL